MRMTLRLVLVGGLLAGSACTGGSPTEPSASARPVRCETGFTAPAGFERFESFEDPYGDHIGVRLGYRDEAGRELHVFSGIPGEFGEGLPSVAEVDVGTAEPAHLLGHGTVWALVWEAEAPCTARAVLGSGFDRTSFLQALRRARVVPA